MSRRYDYQNSRYQPQKRPKKLGKIIVLLLLLLILIGVGGGLLWLRSHNQTYLPFTSYIKVAQVNVIETPNRGLMNIELILFDDNASKISDTNYLVSGDEWRLIGEIISYPGVLSLAGLQSGYKLAWLQGCFDNAMLRSSVSSNNITRTTVHINTSDDSIFETFHDRPWASPVVNATTSIADFIPAGKQKTTYSVYVSQNGLTIKPQPPRSQNGPCIS